MKEDGELGVSDDKQSIFSTLKSRNSCLNPMGHERIKGPQKQGQSSFLRTLFVLVCKDILVYENNLCLQTSASTDYTVLSLNFCLVPQGCKIKLFENCVHVQNHAASTPTPLCNTNSDKLDS